MLEHDFECVCPDCFDNQSFWHKSKEGFRKCETVGELKTAKIIELAEQEGGLKSYITECLSTMPKYNQRCTCTDNIGKVLVEQKGENEYRNVCCVCGGVSKSTLSEREMLIAKIAITQGMVSLGHMTPEKATEELKLWAVQHHYSFEDALLLEKEIDQMFGDDTKR